MTAPASPGQISVLIADDEAAVRAALAAGLDLEPVFTLAGSAATAAEAIALATDTRPDVALVDFEMPGGGQKAVRGILERSPATRVVALSGSSEQHVVLEMLRAGATSYLVKGADPAAIAETILRSASGASILSPEVAASVLVELAGHLDRQQTAEEDESRVRRLIRGVLDEGRVQPLFQPIVDLQANAPVGYEALSRFDLEPPRPPDRWFADAERVGLRTELELLAARSAIRDFVASGAHGFLSLNASAPTLAHCHELIEDMEPGSLVFEITEHHAIEDYEALRPMLAGLRERGALLAVDDAGAGFASLRHTLQLSPDFIKLDLSLIHGIDRDRRRRALAAGLIAFANDVGATIVAEGIETAGELSALRELGVGYGQGYYLAKPAAFTADPHR
jgi:EAL domain-containing protein (putative c-di-GMP-specific phosphodiesterase class I)/DNA-binding NarL/FixJ family response regulator